jgi:hypothetical protein
MHLSYIQVIKVNDVRRGTSKKSGNPYEMQDAECLLLDESGTPSQVGVLMIPKDLMGKVQPGQYAASFSLTVDMERRVTARVTELRPVKIENGKVTALAPLAKVA